MTGGTVLLASKFKASVKDNYNRGKNWRTNNAKDLESEQRQNAIHNNLVNNIVDSASKLKTINHKKDKEKK